MPGSIRLLLRIALAAACAGSALGSATPAGAVALGGEYRYAGLVGSGVATGVRARIAPISRPSVHDGHVAAWIGVGGLDAGPNGEDEWIQVGLASFEGSTTRLYYEVMRGGAWPEYIEIDADVGPGETHRLAVLELVGRPGWWRVLVDGRQIGKPIFLRWSHRAWAPMATTESWSAWKGRARANSFHYRFRRVAFRGGRRHWQIFRRPYVIEDRGLELVRSSRRSFQVVAAGVDDR